jgi:hypothetical protein
MAHNCWGYQGLPAKKSAQTRPESQGREINVVGTLVAPDYRENVGRSNTSDHYPADTFPGAHPGIVLQPVLLPVHIQSVEAEGEHLVGNSESMGSDQARLRCHQEEVHHPWKSVDVPPQPCERSLPPSCGLSIPCGSP